LQDNDTLVFAEVRKRGSENFGGAAASIDQRKQTKLIRTAQHYLQHLKQIPPCRFDAILLNSNNHIEWVKNAFGA
jgi:putative endonuclease